MIVLIQCNGNIDNTMTKFRWSLDFLDRHCNIRGHCDRKDQGTHGTRVTMSKT